MKLHFVHGWGFGPSVWQSLAPLLPDFDKTFADRGYFGGSGDDWPDGPAVWIAHSFGTMLALGAISPRCRGLVAINGFDRFTSDSASAGWPVRVLDRMIARLKREPDQTVADFRNRCGSESAAGKAMPQPLVRDLAALRDGDCRVAAADLKVPVLSLHGAIDPLLPEDMRAQTLRGAPHAAHAVHPDAGHLLPLQQPQWCAGQISAFVAGLH